MSNANTIDDDGDIIIFCQFYPHGKPLAASEIAKQVTQRNVVHNQKKSDKNSDANDNAMKAAGGQVLPTMSLAGRMTIGELQKHEKVTGVLCFITLHFWGEW